MPYARSWTVVSMSWRLTISCSGVPTLRHADTTDRYSDPISPRTSQPRPYGDAGNAYSATEKLRKNVSLFDDILSWNLWNPWLKITATNSTDSHEFPNQTHTNFRTNRFD